MRKLLFVLLGGLLILALPALALAQGQENYVLPEGETFDGNIFYGGNTVTINGNVLGDVAVFGTEININGKITGTLLAAGSNINLGEKADIGGNAFFGASTITINGKIAKNTYAGTSNLTIGEKGYIYQDLYAGASVVTINGNIGRDFYGGAASATIAGSIGRKLNLELDSLTINNSAKINGDVVYRSEKDATINTGSQITGEVIKKAPRTNEAVAKEAAFASYVTGKLYGLFMILLVALVLAYLIPKMTQTLTDSVTKKFWVNLLSGIVVFIVTPILAIMLMATFIGLPISLFVIFCYIVVLYISKIFVGTIAGMYLIKKAWPKMQDKNKLVWSMLLGTIIIYILMIIPVVGGIIGFLATLAVMGALWTERKVLFGNK